jgi:hypothetical protein
MHANSDTDLDPKATHGLLAEPSHLPGDFQAGMHGAAHVILVGNRVTEHREKSVTRSVADMPFVAVHCAQHLLAIAAHQESICLGLHPR